MSVRCAREECQKTVYPLEELKCLDKVWHKQCFKCTQCGMTLSMKTYKGYEKKPYCDSHYPKTVPTAVIDTPEMRRVADITKLQSQVQYHADYEKMKGTKIQLADDPEMERLRQNTKIQSQAQYHGEMEKKKQQDSTRPSQELVGNIESSDSIPVFNQIPNENLFTPHLDSYIANGGGISNYSYGQLVDSDSPYSQRLASQAAGTLVYSSSQGGSVPVGQRQVGSIADYDPMNGKWGKGGCEDKSILDSGNNNTKLTSSQNKQAPAAAVGPAKVGGDKGFTVRALYDYAAADKDEISFNENDVIINCQKVDDGWMTGTVQRTLLWGMLPANYVEKVNQPTGMFKLN